MNHDSVRNPEIPQKGGQFGLDGGDVPVELGVGHGLGSVHGEVSGGVLQERLNNFGGPAGSIGNQGDECQEEVIGRLHERMLQKATEVATGKITREAPRHAARNTFDDVASGKISRDQAHAEGWADLHDVMVCTFNPGRCMMVLKAEFSEHQEQPLVQHSEPLEWKLIWLYGAGPSRGSQQPKQPERQRLQSLSPAVLPEIRKTQLGLVQQQPFRAARE